MTKPNLNSGFVKIVVSLLAIVLLFVLPFLTGTTLPIIGTITFTWMQLFYGSLSLALALAVYVWGVGNWSRFEPPKIPPAASPSPPSDPAKNR
jgi:hypothetical protein